MCQGLKSKSRAPYAEMQSNLEIEVEPALLTFLKSTPLISRTEGEEGANPEIEGES